MHLQIMLYAWLRCDDVWIINSYNFHCFKLIWMICSNWLCCAEVSARWEGDAYSCLLLPEHMQIVIVIHTTFCVLLLTRKLNVCFNKWNAAIVNIYVFYHVFIIGIFFIISYCCNTERCVCVCVCVRVCALFCFVLCQGLTLCGIWDIYSVLRFASSLMVSRES
jgi:hypothetical protein